MRIDPVMLLFPFKFIKIKLLLLVLLIVWGSDNLCDPGQDT